MPVDIHNLEYGVGLLNSLQFKWRKAIEFRGDNVGVFSIVAFGLGHLLHPQGQASSETSTKFTEKVRVEELYCHNRPAVRGIYLLPSYK
ncbi:hypothetical protein RSOLAG1IB_04745 [Rhizoctonia solani AG-1 IB]|uniref:Uncharacterized protein n=1 Tax=Thanatephorus cucumeris (strain AG1-IB / isolate 7/3/14) TaxID=1108050 RepID=A0A0B7FYQ7_THACB|nr:hypothetical protein RSOLAG1IB_04745 [Rhizoctonia solani AG-1 IB]